ncbi:TPA: alpha/beta hydrolase [Pseudomonas aeruginosa]|nr:alpha/beta hydrolase [Pseudomonas aeruginosa]HBN9782203.1 alpha/beta hydrolase [Pseudomonas aeruginosa]HBN9851854.1 alpha/beta hydrolase [Pseudomonas aeruginosa]HBN9865262.1 alpha/beta hydrolase [Pseudomonas aeruginosa]HBN9896612.1 alpha/beta hydrolase [Pseudomonas aeruginosa]
MSKFEEISHGDTETLNPAGTGRRDFVKAAGVSIAALGVMSAAGPVFSASAAPSIPAGADNFYKSDKVTIEKVTFKNQYQMNMVANLVAPKGLDRGKKHKAIIVGHPMGAVKEQSSMLYAQKLAEQGFVTLALDNVFWGESDGEPRNLVAPELYTEGFSAAVDYLGTRTFIDRHNIGVVGICGSGCFSIAAAKIDPRLKAIATVSMYDMGAVTRNGLKHSVTLEQRKALLIRAAENRYQEYTTGKGIFLSYLPDKPTKDTDPVTREFWEFYRTPRGIAIPKGYTLERTQNRMLSSEVRFMNFYPFNDIETITPRPLLFIAGDQAHSREFSEDAFRLSGEQKELVWVPGANHVDLYDRVDLIPWNKLNAFFSNNLA